MTARSEPKIVATMCMLHGRWPDSLKTVRSLEGQVDRLYLCLNDFWAIPSELKQDWIEILHAGRNLGDAARFYLLRNLGHLDAHVIACDDNIEYPKSYVKDFLAEHERQPEALLTYGGATLQRGVDNKIKYNIAMVVFKDSPKTLRLDSPESGSSFIPKPLFNRMEFTSLVHYNQSDTHLACNCRKLDAPIIGLAHAADYVRYTKPPQPVIYETITDKPERQRRVGEIYQSYGLSLEAAAPKPGPLPPSGEDKTVATLCMLQRRWPGSLKTVRSLKGQVSRLYLCLNDFWEVPLELQEDWIEILHLGENLGDAARFYLLRHLGPVDAHVLSCDDDLEYPKSYVRDFLAAHKQYREALLTYHGDIAEYDENDQFRYVRALSALRNDDEGVYKKMSPKAREALEQTRDRNRAVRLAISGAGVSFIPKSIFNRMEFSDLVHLNQADVHLACNCQKLGVPIIGLSCQQGYIHHHNPTTDSIYHTFTKHCDHLEIVRQIFASYGLKPEPPPWGADTADARPDRAGDSAKRESAPEPIVPRRRTDQVAQAGDAGIVDKIRVALPPLISRLRMAMRWLRAVGGPYMMRLLDLLLRLGRAAINRLRQRRFR